MTATHTLERAPDSLVRLESPGNGILDDLARLAVLSLASEHSRRKYSFCIREYLKSAKPLNREGVLQYLNTLGENGAGPVTRNVTLAAIRLLAREAHLRDLISDGALAGIERIKGIPVRGTKSGNWLDLPSVEALIESAGHGVNRVRNQALVAIACGCGLRRSEITSLTWKQWTKREDRWCFCDLVGKAGRTRTVPVPQWVAEYVLAYREQSEPNNIRLFDLTPQSAFVIVRDSARRAGLGEVRPHDLRRTFAKLARKGGASIEQISQVLGHSSIDVTQRYLGINLELRGGKAAVDFVKP